MKTNPLRRLALFLVLTMMINLASVDPTLGPFSNPRYNPKYVRASTEGQFPSVDSELFRQLANDETSSYLIYLRHRADLSPAHQMDWE
ncbi:MAG: hypothetical protein IBX69_02585, partial [Anaerolineales bacterium]|nr:hypothetical protein [Anaerolineales bacterium]